MASSGKRRRLGLGDAVSEDESASDKARMSKKERRHAGISRAHAQGGEAQQVQAKPPEQWEKSAE